MNNSIEIGDKVKIMDDCSAPNAGSEGTVIWISRRLNFTGFKVEIPEIGIVEYARHEIEKLPSTAKPRILNSTWA